MGICNTKLNQDGSIEFSITMPEAQETFQKELTEQERKVANDIVLFADGTKTVAEAISAANEQIFLMRMAQLQAEEKNKQEKQKLLWGLDTNQDGSLGFEEIMVMLKRDQSNLPITRYLRAQFSELDFTSAKSLYDSVNNIQQDLYALLYKNTTKESNIRHLLPGIVKQGILNFFDATMESFYYPHAAGTLQFNTVVTEKLTEQSQTLQAAPEKIVVFTKAQKNQVRNQIVLYKITAIPETEEMLLSSNAQALQSGLTAAVTVATTVQAVATAAAGPRESLLAKEKARLKKNI